MKLRRVFQVPMKTRRKHVVVLELLHLEMEVTVSEPSDVISVGDHLCFSKISTTQRWNFCTG